MNTKKKLKILIIGPDSPHVENFISRLNTDHYQLEVISSGSRHISFKPNFIVNFSLVKFWNLILTPLKIRRLSKKFKPDMVWLHQANSFSFYPILALKNKYPLALTVWGSDILVAPNQSFFIRVMTRYILKRIDVITADARYLGEKALELSDRKNTPLHICQFGINPTDVPLEKEQIIYSNRGHKPLYRITDVIHAFKRFQEGQESKWKLVVAGSGYETDNLKKMVQNLDLNDQVEFVGFLSQSENASWYGRSKVFISIPQSDGTAVSLLEAMYYGCLPIVSDLPANREWINHRENGYIVANLHDNFIEDALKVDISLAQKINKQLIESLATPDASREKFELVIAQTLESKKTL